MSEPTRPSSGSETILRLGLAVLAALLVTVPAMAGDQGTAQANSQSSKPTEAKPAAKPASGAAATPAAPPVSPFLAAARGQATADSDVVVITNDDLNKLSGGGVYVVKPAVSAEGAAADAAAEGDDAVAGAVEASPTEAPADVDPLVWMQQQREQKQQQADAAAEARGKVAELEQRKAELEKRLRAIRNPLLPRPQVTGKDDEAHGTKWDDLSATERVSRTETDLQQVEDELAAARAELDAAGS